jgi:hypothetical protein
MKRLVRTTALLLLSHPDGNAAAAVPTAKGESLCRAAALKSFAMSGSRAVQAVYYNLCDICVSSVASLLLRLIKYIIFSTASLARLLVLADTAIEMQHCILSAAVYTESCCLAGAEAKCERSFDRGFCCCSVSTLRSACT